MDRRTFIRTVSAGSAAAVVATNAVALDRYFPIKADQKLFDTINRAKIPGNLTPLEQKHVPLISAPKQVRAGEPFIVTVRVGETIHPMGPTHWIQFVELSVGNEPAGRLDLQSRGFLSPNVTFMVTIEKNAAPAGKVTLVANERCNLHGYWEGNFDIEVV